ncbi:hypothetical protein FJ251_13615 [bacterium]|nr:hypothetical protein [bacterium]
MARCTAPVRGHRTASGAAACPACGGRYRSYGGYGSYPHPFYPSWGSSGGGRSSIGGSGGIARPRWSRVGIVLVTPTLLRRIEGESIAERELSALLARDLLVPIVHDTTYEALREVSPLLGSRSGLDTAEDSMERIAAKLAELVAL